MRRNRGVLFAAVFAAFLALLSACSKAAMPAQTQLHMGTVCSINLFEDGSRRLYGEMFGELERLERIFSVNLPDSDVSRVNRAAGAGPVKVSPQLVLVLEEACRIAAASGGAFDPTVGPLVRLWGIGGDNPRVPSGQEIGQALPLVDYRLVRIDRAESTVFLPLAGMALDLGGIAKGYAADCLAELARSRGVERALLDLGGNVYAFGKKPDGSLWRVGIKNPHDPAAYPVARLELADRSVVTSGMYERFFEQDGTRYHHILDTRTGRPAQGDVLSATVVAESSMLADALSTGAFVLGAQKGMELVLSQNAEAVLVLADKSVCVTRGISGGFKLLSGEFSLAVTGENDN